MDYTVEQAEKMLNARPEIADNFVGKVTGVTVVSVAEITDDNGRDKVIINLNLSTGYQLDNAFVALDKKDVQGALNSNMSCSYLLPTSKFIPSKGEIVDVIVTQAPRKDGGTFAKATAVVEMRAIAATSRKQRTIGTADTVEATAEEVLGKK